MTQSIDTARMALRQRQGSGARYDADNAPARELDWARRGTAYFARLLNDLPATALDEASAVAGFTRRRLIAYIGYHARLTSEMIAWARTGEDGAFPRAARVNEADLEFGVTQPSRALRYLFDHSQAHLNVEWRDLDATGWNGSIADAGGRMISLRSTPVMRAAALWLHAVDLDSGGRFADMPDDLLDRLIVQHAAQRLGTHAVALSATDRTGPLLSTRQAKLRVTGRAADIARWLSGRGVRNLECVGGALPTVGPPALIGF